MVPWAFFLRDTQIKVSGMLDRLHTCCWTWGHSWYSLPYPLSTPKFSHPELLSPWVMVACLVMSSRPLYLSYLKAWYLYTLQSRDVAHICSQLTGNDRRCLHRTHGFRMYPPHLHCVKAAPLPPAHQRQLPLGMVNLLFTIWSLEVLPGSRHNSMTPLLCPLCWVCPYGTSISNTEEPRGMGTGSTLG